MLVNTSKKDSPVTLLVISTKSMDKGWILLSQAMDEKTSTKTVFSGCEWTDVILRTQKEDFPTLEVSKSQKPSGWAKKASYFDLAQS